VGAYHALIAKLIMLDAYAEFTHTQKEDRMCLEGLALWAGHDYSSTNRVGTSATGRTSTGGWS
jgi:hypothetical protein